MKTGYRRALLGLAVLAVTVWCFVLPLWQLAVMSVTDADGQVTLSAMQSLLAEERTRRATWNTVVIAVVSTAMAMVIGLYLAWLVAYTNIRHKRWLTVLTLAPYVIPSYVIAIAWGDLLSLHGGVNRILTWCGIGPVDLYSLWGIIWTMGWCHVPLVFLFSVTMLRKIPREWEWAARLAGCGRVRSFFVITLPHILPALLGGGMLAFLAAVDNFSIPALLGISSGVPVLSTYIYEKAIGFGPAAFHDAAILSVVLAVLVLAAAWVQRRVLRTSRISDSMWEDPRPRVEFRPAVRRCFESSALAVLGTGMLIPLAALFMNAATTYYGAPWRWENLTAEHFVTVLTNDGIRRAALTSVGLAVATAVICLAVGTWAAVRQRSGDRTVRWLEQAAALTYALPGIVLALAIIFHWGTVRGVYGTVYILLIAYVTRYLILQIKGSQAALASIAPSQEEAAAVAGASRPARWRRVMLPMMAAQMGAAAFFFAISAATELTLSSLLAGANVRTVGLAIFGLQQGGDYSLADAVSALLVAVIAGGYLLWRVIERHCARRDDKKG